MLATEVTPKSVFDEIYRQLLDTGGHDIFNTAIIDKNRKDSLIRTFDASIKKIQPSKVSKARQMEMDKAGKKILDTVTPEIKKMFGKADTDKLDQGTMDYLNKMIKSFIDVAEIAKKRGSVLDDAINAKVLSLAMSGGKTVMEGVLAKPFFDYAKGNGFKGLIIIKNEDLANKVMKGKPTENGRG